MILHDRPASLADVTPKIMVENRTDFPCPQQCSVFIVEIMSNEDFHGAPSRLQDTQDRSGVTANGINGPDFGVAMQHIADFARENRGCPCPFIEFARIEMRELCEQD